VFGLGAGVQALHEQHVPLAVLQRALIDRGPRRGATLATPIHLLMTSRALCILNQKAQSDY